MSANIYQLRRYILEALKEYNPTPCNAEAVQDYPKFALLQAENDEIRTQWKELRAFGYIAPIEGFEGKYCRITDKGLQQLSPEFKKEPFIWGPMHV